MAALAEAAPCRSRERGLSLVDGDHHDIGTMEQQIELAATRVAEPGLDDDAGLQQRRGGDGANGGIRKRLNELGSVGLVEQDRDEGRRVDHHQVVKPSSS